MVIDIIVLVVLLISASIAFLRGFIRETLTILGVVGGLAAAYFGGPYLRPVMSGWLGIAPGADPEKLFGIIPMGLISDALSYGLIFIVVVGLLSFASHMLAESVRNIGLGAIDRTLGVLFGLARAVILLGLIYMPFQILLDQETKEQWFAGSRSFVYLEEVSKAMASLLPEETADNFEKDVRGLGETLGAGTAAKDHLKGIDVLGTENKEAPGDETLKPAPEEDNRGYTPEFRQKMDELFENETQETR